MEKVAIFCFASVVVFLFGVLFDTLEVEDLGIFLNLLGAIGFVFSLVFLVFAFVNKITITKNGPDYKKLDDCIVIISTYNEIDKTKNPSVYSKLVEEIEEYNGVLETYYNTCDFYNITIPDKLKDNYPKIIYDYTNNEAVWENGGIVVYGN